MTQKEQKYFAAPDGRLNADDADVACGLNEWCDLRNLRTGTTDDGVTSVAESVWGNALRSTPEPSVTHLYMGSAWDAAEGRILYFLKDIYGTQDKIKAYYPIGGLEYTVLLSSQVTGGLSFHKWSFIHSARVVNGHLYWTDNLNEPRRLNIDAAIKLNHPDFSTDEVAYTAPLAYEIITLIRRPLNYPLQVTKKKATDVGLTLNTNSIKNGAFRFTAFVEFRKGERSTLSMHSKLVPYNFPQETTDGYNVIEVKLPLSQAIGQDVQRVILCVVYADTNQAFEIKTWDKDSATDSSAIAAHNSGTTALTHYFTNTEVGAAIDTATLVKPFDSVPLLSEALERAVHRLLLGNNLMGYDTPTLTSLSADVFSGAAGTASGQWTSYDWALRDDPGMTTSYFAYFPVAVDATHPAGFYDLTASPTGGNPTDTLIDINDYTFVCADPATAATDIGGYIASLFGELQFGAVGSMTEGAVSASNTSPSADVAVLKADSSRKVAIVFYDRFMRQCGVRESNSGVITTPDRSYSDPTSYNYSIQWTLSNTAALTEIPDWAYYYSIVATKDLKRTFFAQARAGDIVYATKDSAGVYVFTTNTYSASHAGVALKLDILDSYGMGYEYNEGDIIKVYLSGGSTVYSLSVLGQDSNWVVAELDDLGDLTSASALFEIYTPQVQSAGQFYYEQGSLYAVTNPGAADRSYAVTQGYLPGDVYLLSRDVSPSDYLVEAMSPSKTLWQNWLTQAGRVQVVDRTGQQRLEGGVRWSNTRIDGTRINGLSSFDSPDQKLLPAEMGTLRKLQLTSKVGNEQGGIMLALCEQQTASLYMGEVQLYGATRAGDLAQTADVIGTVNVLKGDYGTQNPEAVTEYRGMVVWPDARSGKWVQYASNGLFPFSAYKTVRLWKQFFKTYTALSRQQIEDMGGRPFLFTAVDPGHEELLISLPTVLSQPPQGYLPDYPSTIYPFDLWDGQGKTMVYKLDLGLGNPHWQGAYDFVADGFTMTGDSLYAHKNGHLYEQGVSGSVTFFGNPFRPSVSFYGNLFGGLPKVAQNLSLEANLVPTLTYVRSEVPYQQATDLMDYEWKDLEGVWYATLRRNKLTPTATGLTTGGLLSGEKMRAVAFRFHLQWTLGGERLQLRRVTIGYQLSRGHQNIIVQ